MAVVQPFADGFMGLWNGMSSESLKYLMDTLHASLNMGSYQSVSLGAILIIDLVTPNFGQLERI